MIGQTLAGRYYIERNLGQGGFSRTFVAEDRLRPGNPECVVKQLLPFNPSSLDVARRLFDTEAQILEKLGTHDQIPQLLARFEENGEFYLVQEFVAGNTLETEISPGKQWSETDVVRFLKDILEALVFVQQHRVVHRDLNPKNLIRRAADNKIVLIDFGAVKEIATKMNKRTIAIGTPGYMPLEQVAGKPNFSSDIYAVGTMAIQAITGLLPCQLIDVDGVLVWRNHGRASARLADILDKMVRSNWKERYQSAAEVLQDLEDYINAAGGNSNSTLNQQINPPPTPPTVVSKPRIPVVFIALGVAVFIGALGLVFFWWKQPRPEPLVKVYENRERGVKIKYPDGWSGQEIDDIVTGDVVVLLSPQEGEGDIFRERVRVTVENSQGVSLDQYTLESLEIIRQSSDKNVSDASLDTLAGRQGRMVVYRGREDNVEVKKMAVWAVKNNRAYVVTYTAEVEKFDEFQPTARAMVESLEILD